MGHQYLKNHNHYYFIRCSNCILIISLGYWVESYSLQYVPIVRIRLMLMRNIVSFKFKIIHFTFFNIMTKYLLSSLKVKSFINILISIAIIW